jgi:hypothetical protein
MFPEIKINKETVQLIFNIRMAILHSVSKGYEQLKDAMQKHKQNMRYKIMQKWSKLQITILLF